MTKITVEVIDQLCKGVDEVRTPTITIDRDLARDVFHELRLVRKMMTEEHPMDFARCYLVQEMTMDYARALFADHVLDWTDIAMPYDPINIEGLLKEVSERIKNKVYVADPVVSNNMARVSA